jgi:hypothetical protein
MFKFYYFVSKGWKSFVLLFGGCLLLLHSYAQPGLGANLIYNGDAEMPVLSNGWTQTLNELGGIWYLTNGDAYLAMDDAMNPYVAKSGSSLFSGGNMAFPGGRSEITQTIDLTNPSLGLDSKDLTFAFNGYVATDGSFSGQYDIVKVTIDYYDASFTNVYSYSSNFVPAGPTDNAWFNLADIHTVQASDNVTSIVITLYAENENTSNSVEAYFDNLSLVAGTTLPISLLDFAAVQRGDRTVALDWKTAQEENSHYIEVQRSGDGKTFLPIGQVAAAGNSQSITDYSFVDGLPLPGSNFYRLKLVDLDGSYKYSKVLLIKAAASDKTIEVFGNPFHDQIGLRIQAMEADRLVLSLMDGTGRSCLRQTMSVQTGNNFINLYPSAGMAAGLYLLHVQGAHMDQTIKVLKK